MKSVMEGTVIPDLDGPALVTAKRRDGYCGAELLTPFVGKRVRVTIEVLPDPDEDCPPATDADGRKPSDNKAW